jgi:hypothetical protein
LRETTILHSSLIPGHGYEYCWHNFFTNSCLDDEGGITIPTAPIKQRQENFDKWQQRMDIQLYK